MRDDKRLSLITTRRKREALPKPAPLCPLPAVTEAVIHRERAGRTGQGCKGSRERRTTGNSGAIRTLERPTHLRRIIV